MVPGLPGCSLEHQSQAWLGPLAPFIFVRLPVTDYASVMRPREAGAGGLMISMVRSASGAEQAVRWAKFWPRGERGLKERHEAFFPGR